MERHVAAEGSGKKWYVKPDRLGKIWHVAGDGAESVSRMGLVCEAGIRVVLWDWPGWVQHGLSFRTAGSRHEVDSLTGAVPVVGQVEDERPAAVRFVTEDGRGSVPVCPLGCDRRLALSYRVEDATAGLA